MNVYNKDSRTHRLSVFLGTWGTGNIEAMVWTYRVGFLFCAVYIAWFLFGG